MSFTVNNRGYGIDGRTYPRVTSILDCMAKPALVGWAAKVTAQFAWDNRNAWINLPEEHAVKLLKGAPNELKEKAGSRGSVVHNTLEAFLMGVPLPEEFTEDERLTAEAGMQFLRDYKPKPIGVEVTTYSPSMNYAGTCDLPAELEGPLAWNGDGAYILDWKTSNYVYGTYAMQLTAYATAERCFIDGIDQDTPWLDKVKGMGIVHITPKGYTLYKVVTPLEEMVKHWEAVRAVSAWMKEEKKQLAKLAPPSA